jgi:long-chain acyl-CoA synthetase
MSRTSDVDAGGARPLAELSVPPLISSGHPANLPGIVVDNATQAPHHPVFARRVGARVDSEWQDVSAREFLVEVTALAKGLIAAGIRPGDRVALLSKTRYEWTLSDVAIWFAGAVSVPVYETSSLEQLRWILSDSAAVGIIVESAAHETMLAQIRADVSDLKHVWVIDEGAVQRLGVEGGGVEDAEVGRRCAALSANSLATIIYTSGTTGRPKGCELTHGNFLAEARNVVHSTEEIFLADGACTLLFLPLAHVFARVIEVGCLLARAQVAHTSDVKHLVEDLASFQPSFILAVPRVFEKIYNASAQRAEAAGRGKVFAAAADTAIAYSEALDTGRLGAALRLRHVVFDRLVYGKLRAALGGNLQYAVSGGAPLGARLGHFFRGIGVVILEGYGLTETTAGCTLNLPEAPRIGTVGRPVPGIGIRINADGEVLVRGQSVFARYYNNPEATAAAFSDGGWFHTGDLGELDRDGFLRIIGRKKEIIVTASGKNVAPSVLEDRLRAHALVSQCMVVGDAKPYIAALVTLDAEALRGWLEHRGKPPMTVAEAAADPDVRAQIQLAVDDANTAVSKAEAIKRFAVLDIDFTEDNDYLTPSLKLKRAMVAKDFAGDIDALYS